MTIKTNILKLAGEFYEQHQPHWRWGQAVYNAAHTLYPEQAGALASSYVDCFHRDWFVGEFLDELSSRVAA